MDLGVLEIITCAATHGFLPLMENFPESVRAQILIARDHYREMFGRDPVGIWLPECALRAGPRSGAAGGQSPLVRRRCARADVWQSAPPLRHLRALLHPGGPRRFWARPRLVTPGLEQRGRLPGRPGVSRFLSRHRLRSLHRVPPAFPGGESRAQVHRPQVPPHHRARRRKGLVSSRLGTWRGRSSRLALHECARRSRCGICAKI